jgi:hypothetical protein
MSGRPKDPDYWRKWRAAHPAYRARERARSAARGMKSHGDRAGQRARARIRLQQRNGDNGGIEPGHPIVDQAIAIARRFVSPDHRRDIVVPLYEEAVCIAALAICADEDAPAAVESFVKAERGWGYRTAPILVEVHDPAYVACIHGYMRAGWCWDCAREEAAA